MQVVLIKDIDFEDSVRQDGHLSQEGGVRRNMNMTMTPGRGQKFGS